jgi:hypothetical protein
MCNSNRWVVVVPDGFSPLNAFVCSGPAIGSGLNRRGECKEEIQKGRHFDSFHLLDCVFFRVDAISRVLTVPFRHSFNVIFVSTCSYLCLFTRIATRKIAIERTRPLTVSPYSIAFTFTNILSLDKFISWGCLLPPSRARQSDLKTDIFVSGPFLAT